MANKQIKSETLHKAFRASCLTFVVVVIFLLILFLTSCRAHGQFIYDAWNHDADTLSLTTDEDFFQVEWSNRAKKRHRVEMELYDSDGQAFGYSLEATNNLPGERIIFISLTGGEWISMPYLNKWLIPLACLKTLVRDDSVFYRFIMVDDKTKTMGQCICNINIQIARAIMENKKG